MSALATPAAVMIFDVNTVGSHERHMMVLDKFATLAPGQALELVTDRDPGPLLEQFALELPGRFEWQGEQGPPDLWRVRIGKPLLAPG